MKNPLISLTCTELVLVLVDIVHCVLSVAEVLKRIISLTIEN
nr:hypothetical protein [uncultured Allomuricauda sp.]